MAKPETKCDQFDIDELTINPLDFSGKIFCGEARLVEYGRTVRLLPKQDGTLPSNDLAFLVTIKSRKLLPQLSDTPKKYYLEAMIVPQRQCFLQSKSGEDCSPFRRPVFIHIRRAHLRP
jgi:hypothetical protein